MAAASASRFGARELSYAALSRDTNAALSDDSRYSSAGFTFAGRAAGACTALTRPW